jgi:hypothetical protein
MKYTTIMLGTIVLALLSACGIIGEGTGSANDEPGITGYVMAVEGERILVVATEAQDFSDTGGVNEFYDAIMFANVPEDIRIGDKVHVWYDEVAESYPGQSTAKRIEKVPPVHPEGADLTDSDVLHHVLTTNEIVGVAAVQSIDYDPQADTWTVKIKDVMMDDLEDEVYEFEVEDGEQ